ncbi:DUF421 domain-containing protein [Deinococcus budaensis]|uniref:Uncharacterized membrane protein YcaP (DUF421 family) n=1 Tax=Deinococcus budaensis TaxID=1665626 RepID=A0A7W8GGC6_9DEIO|nr:YetF domain-containing protein [Deinococcus budaensis]MBB5234646.1 uncharacterized membrane protein YcaP (DUF421 family) [Deinococcus budaensis]
MFQQLQQWAVQIETFLDYDRSVSDVGGFEMALRTILIYLFSLFLVRIGSKRFLNQASAFDVIIGIMLGSVMSRAINSSAPLFPTLGAGLVLIGLHALLVRLAYRSGWFGPLVKGNPVLLIKDGQLQMEGLRETGVARNDLDQALRLQGRTTDPSDIKLAYLERNGQISMVSQDSGPRVLEVKVEDGVQTVRIRLE